jgi:putative ABC transport system permease protein
MRRRLAFASLRRRRTRSLLAILGVAVSGALLLDMVMLAGGMRDSFRRLLLVQGFQLRIAPKGTLPFDTQATIPDASAITATLHANPDIIAVSPILGEKIHVLHPREMTSVAIGIDGSVQGDFELLRGSTVGGANHIVVNQAFLDASGAHLGDTLDAAAGFDTQLRTYTGRRPLIIAGVGRFYYTAAGEAVAAVPLATLQVMGGPAAVDRVSLFMAKVRDGVDPDRVRRWIEAKLPRISAISTSSALQQFDQRMGYFRQLAVILGSISLGVGFLLVTTLVTVSVNERIGEIAVMRAIGVSRQHVVEQIVLEGIVLALAGTILGLGLGLVTARAFNAILSDFPGLPAAFRFFVFRPRDAYAAMSMLVAAGVLAGIYPAWRAASLPVADTLHGEAIA